MVGLSMLPWHASAQTDGSVDLAATLTDYPGNGDNHWTVVWVETAAGGFIKTLWKQGPSSFTTTHWRSHCREWWDSKNGSSAFDGYSSSSARDYSGVNSPVRLSWDCRDAANNLVADGDYKFWIQYAEDDGQGPFTTGGLPWTKGPASDRVRYQDQAGYFSNMSVVWTAVAPPPVAPSITSGLPPGTGIVGVPYQFTSTATGTEPIGFTASGLPTGLSMSEAGEISGIPNATGIFAGTITATNGTLPNATQAISVTIDEVPTTITTVQTEGLNLIMGGTGPSNGVFSVMTTTNIGVTPGQWTPLTTGTTDASGAFSTTNTLDGAQSPLYYQLRIP